MNIVNRLKHSGRSQEEDQLVKYKSASQGVEFLIQSNREQIQRVAGRRAWIWDDKLQDQRAYPTA